jgi:hypothetical protein
MDKILKIVKFGLDNRAAILSVWILIFGAIGTGLIATQKPVEQVTIPLPIPEQPKPKVAVNPPKVVTRIEPIDYSKVRQIATEVCEKINHDHDRRYHFE